MTTQEKMGMEAQLMAAVRAIMPEHRHVVLQMARELAERVPAQAKKPMLRLVPRQG